MCCTEYHNFSSYFESFTVLTDRIKAIELIIDQNILLMADTAAGIGGNVSMYELDDGQVRIKTGYRSVEDVTKGITALETMRQMYLNRLNGRATVLVDRHVRQRSWRGGCR